jgi:hypothetical protein
MEQSAIAYLDLMEKTLTGMIYQDNPIDPWSKDVGFDMMKRLNGWDWPAQVSMVSNLDGICRAVDHAA